MGIRNEGNSSGRFRPPGKGQESADDSVHNRGIGLPQLIFARIPPIFACTAASRFTPSAVTR